MPSPTRPSTWARSIPTPRAVSDLVAEHYDMAVTQATLVRAFVNDVFAVSTPGGHHAFKLYGVGRFEPDEVRWEQQLAHHLEQAGIPSAAPVPLTDGDWLGTSAAPEGERLFTLTRWVPGNKPQPPWTDELYRTVGAALGRWHQAADAFTSTLPRRVKRRGDEPEKLLAALDSGVVGQDAARRELVQRSSDEARAALTVLAERGLRWGLTHGDPTLDNLHLDGDIVHFYDLDLAGPGWQVEDLGGAMSTEFADAFLSGYLSTHTLPQLDQDALPWLRVLSHLDNLEFHVVTKAAAMGTATLAEGWVDRGFEGLEAALRDAASSG